MTPERTSLEPVVTASGKRLRTGTLWILLAVLALGSGSLGCLTTDLTAAEQRATDLRIAVAKRNVGIDFLAKGRTPMAIRELQHSYTLNPEDPVTIHWLGEAYRRRGLLDKALDHFLMAQELIPADADLLLNLTGLYVQLKRFPEAIETSITLIEDPTFPAPWKAFVNKGWAELQLGYAAEARASFEEALAFQPAYWPARLNLGILDSQEGRGIQAIVNFERVLERNLGRRAEAETNYRLGKAYVTLGRRGKALQYFKVAAETAPHDRWGRDSEEYIKLLH
jgi:type IV pilus assembly protein PilF